MPWYWVSEAFYEETVPGHMTSKDSSKESKAHNSKLIKHLRHEQGIDKSIAAHAIQDMTKLKLSLIVTSQV